MSLSKGPVQVTKVALFGGSFNPPHAGHEHILKWLVHNCPLDLHEIWVLPVVNHAHDKDLLPYEMRAKMVTEMVKGAVGRGMFNNHGDACKVVRRDEKYTVEMLEALHVEMPSYEFFLVVGADILHETDRWERWDDVLKLATLIPVSRHGHEPPAGITAHDIKGPDPSSTDIRLRLAKNDLTYLTGEGADVPERVISFIKAEELYGYKRVEREPRKVQVDYVTIPVKTLIDQWPPGKPFCLRRPIRQIFGVGLVKTPIEGDLVDAFRFRVLVDTEMVNENESEIRSWMRDQTRARSKGEEFTTPKPEPTSFGLTYLKQGGEPFEGFVGDFIGVAGDYVFFKGGASSESLGGFFGGLFGGLL